MKPALQEVSQLNVISSDMSLTNNISWKNQNTLGSWFPEVVEIIDVLW